VSGEPAGWDVMHWKKKKKKTRTQSMPGAWEDDERREKNSRSSQSRKNLKQDFQGDLEECRRKTEDVNGKAERILEEKRGNGGKNKLERLGGNPGIAPIGD